MRTSTRLLALALAGALLGACGQKDQNAPLAFVPADTPYVVANLAPLGHDARDTLLTQANTQLPGQLAQLDAAATRAEARNDQDGARLLRALRAEFHSGSIEGFARDAGLDLDGHLAFYGLGLAPVLRIDLKDAKAFQALVTRLEKASGSKLENAHEGAQAYRLGKFPASGTELVIATSEHQAVIALLPLDAPRPLLLEALGLDRPQHSLQDDGGLARLARDKGYRDTLVGRIDFSRALPLALGPDDAFVMARRKALAVAVAAETGEPVENQLKTDPTCADDAARIAARVPALSFGYTRLDANHQDARLDLALAPDIRAAFNQLTVALPGLGKPGTAPIELSLAIPVAELRAFLSAQAEAVGARPFTCPALANLNDSFAGLGPAMQQAAIPPFGDFTGLRLALDSLLPPGKDSMLPSFTGRLMLGSRNPEGLLATGQLMVSALAALKPKADGTPLPLPADMAALLGQDSWLAMTPHTLSLGIGAGEDKALAAMQKDPTANAGQMLRLHISGAMYRNMLELLEDGLDRIGAAAAAVTGNDDSAATKADIADELANSKSQFEAMKPLVERIEGIDAEMHVDAEGIVITSQTQMK